jgi:VIT1/CCC1 family predicted Fe2+/Mn2+ transporter
MPALETNPFAILTFIAAPAILANASSVLALGTSHRFARTIDRTRAMIRILVVALLTGVAGLIAGAISMALGEYTSVKTQNEQLDLEVARERAEMERNPRGEVEELAEMIRARGVDPGLAEEVAEQLHRDREAALRLHIVAEVGLSPDDKPSPRTAAFSSLLTFSTGAIFPLLPYLFGLSVLWPALVSGGIGLLLAGALSSRFTPRPWWFAGLRQLLFGAVAAGATYLIGLAIGSAAG